MTDPSRYLHYKDMSPEDQKRADRMRKIVLKVKAANLHPINQAALHRLKETDWGPGCEDRIHAATLMLWAMDKGAHWITPTEPAGQLLTECRQYSPTQMTKIVSGESQDGEEATIFPEDILQAPTPMDAAALLLETWMGGNPPTIPD